MKAVGGWSYLYYDTIKKIVNPSLWDVIVESCMLYSLQVVFEIIFFLKSLRIKRGTPDSLGFEPVFILIANGVVTHTIYFCCPF